MQLSFATTNDIKFNKYSGIFQNQGITLLKVPVDVEELQLDDGKDIVIRKAQDSYTQVQKPVMVTDDSWEIPALDGFPGPYMKYCNQKLRGEDWLRLIGDTKQRELYLITYVAVTNGKKTQTWQLKENFYFLDSVRIKVEKYHHLSAVAREGDTVSVAERIADGSYSGQEHVEFWNKVAQEAKKIIQL